MAEEKLSIDGIDDVPTSKPSASAEGMFQAKHEADVSSSLVPSSDSRAIVDAILAAPDEKLIPWETCALPSRGLYYGWTNGNVQVRAMTQTAEKILATQRLAQSGEAIDYLFKNCCQFPAGFEPQQLLVGDKTFILFYLRGITYGNLYEFGVKCPECETMSTYTYDLNGLANTIKWADPNMGSGPFRVDLPHLTQVMGRPVWIRLRFLTSGDTNSMVQREKAKKKTNSKVRNSGVQTQREVTIDQTISDNLDLMTISLMDDVTDRMSVRRFIEKLHAVDTSAIRDWLKKYTPGIDTTVEIECNNCSHEYKIGLPITEDFFRPAKSGGSG